MTYNPAKRPRHPVKVAYLSDSAFLAQVANRLDADMETAGTAPGRQALIHAITILRGASKNLGN